MPVENYIDDFYAFLEARLESDYTEKTFTCIALHKCVNQVIAGWQSGKAGEGYRIINAVHPEMLVSTDKDTLTEIVACLLHTIIMNGLHPIIHFSAKLIGNITLIHIRTSNTGYNATLADNLHKVEPLAEKLGGCITLSNNKRYGLTLTFTFINQ
ncbi:MAG: hypothetical protein Q8941_07705 [Bacteroidota bacterium]|nr:hypothetical protein [Bacteroidota bacterium]